MTPEERMTCYRKTMDNLIVLDNHVGETVRILLELEEPISAEVMNLSDARGLLAKALGKLNHAMIISELQQAEQERKARADQ